MSNEKMIVGRVETLSLPELNIDEIEARIDTGAKTSSLHVDHIRKFKRDGKLWVSFEIHPHLYQVEDTVICESPLQDIRRIKSSNGAVEERYIISTPIELGGQRWEIEISLTDRSDMSYLMLLGREAMGKRILVDPSLTFATQR